MELFDKIFPYYAIAVQKAFGDIKGNNKTLPQIAQMFAYNFKQETGQYYYDNIHKRMLFHVVSELLVRNVVEVVPDDFAPEYVIWSIKGASQLIEAAPTTKPVLDKLKTLGKDEFLYQALDGFASKYGKEVVDELDKPEAIEKKSDDKEKLEDTITNQLDGPDWEPLPIERESKDAKDAIEKSEIALSEIEQSNGYAATSPDERNGVVETIKGTLSAIKNGFPSREAIASGLLAPLRFIAKKFGDASMGEAAKMAVLAIIKWLS